MGIGALFSGFVNTITGGLGNKIIDTAKEYWPPDMSPEKKAQFELAMQNLELKIRDQANQEAADSDRRLNERINSQEGTANDLKMIPIIGPIVIFLRGCQRPMWGFATMYFDYKWFVNNASFTENQEYALIGINLMVLIFLFGERSIKNVLPMVLAYRDKVNTKQ